MESFYVFPRQLHDCRSKIRNFLSFERELATLECLRIDRLNIIMVRIIFEGMTAEDINQIVR